ncbi:MAG: 3-deoxy-8-phosphooctulonate synthase [Acidobacteriia bacterium]|nr:3-deoxy-8-phosphooctulonate synthase [Terriglobia bacterium]
MEINFKIGNFKVGQGTEIFLIAGPCVIESEKHALKMAESIAKICERLKVPYVFKASYDKANRTSVRSFRGPGLKKGLAVLRKIKRTLGLPLLTDVHELSHVGPAAEICDVLQIPAFLCRQTDLLLEAGKSRRVVNIKKGQFVSPWEIRNAVEKVRSTGNEKIMVTERGAMFGYNNLVVDMRSFPIMREMGYPVVFDVTHSVQIPAGAGHQSGGQAQFIPHLARAGVAAGVDGVFMEVHDRPEKALSDGANALHLRLLPRLLGKLLEINRVVKTA